jgi:homogentisate 1,2-dioxygenase
MLDRACDGELPPKHHLALRGEGGVLRYEECLTRRGFDGAYSILYHVNRPQALTHVSTRASAGHATRVPHGVRRRHFRTRQLGAHVHGAEPVVPVLESAAVTLSVLMPRAEDARYHVDADADALYFIRKGSGTLRSVFGDLTFGPNDYVCVPKGVLHRFAFDRGPHDGLRIDCQDLAIPKQWRNEVGQLRMDAPYCHRDFRRPSFTGPCDEGIRELVVHRDGQEHVFRAAHAPLDVLGWDGTVYPWAFPILAFQPRVSSVHLPPTWHGTFAASGALICSFVPRPLDFHPDAIPCPYPHASVDVDEVLYYVTGNFPSRTGIDAGSITLHPRGVPHGPQPGRYEASVGQTHTEELAVMLDVFEPLQVTDAALAIEDAGYDESFAGTA